MYRTVIIITFYNMMSPAVLMNNSNTSNDTYTTCTKCQLLQSDSLYIKDHLVINTPIRQFTFGHFKITPTFA